MDKGYVLFTKKTETELGELEKLVPQFDKVFYIYSKRITNDLDVVKSKYPNFEYMRMKAVTEPNNMQKLKEATKNDLIVIKNPRLGNIMDENVDFLQIVVKGYFFVVDDHPFMGKRKMFWFYFPWSFFDKSLLGYPHSYAFRDAEPTENYDPYDPDMLAQKVSSATKIDYKRFFNFEIEEVDYELTIEEHEEYQKLKEKLFEEEKDHRPIIRKLKEFVDKTESKQKAVAQNFGHELNIEYYVKRLYKKFREGQHLAKYYKYVSDAKVDIFLNKRTTKYIENTNKLTEALWRWCNNG